MILCNFYLRKSVVYIPTMAKVENHAHYREIDPVAVVPLTNCDSLRKAIRDAMDRGNPLIPFVMPEDLPPPILLKYAGVKSWSAFSKTAQLWSLKQKAGGYEINGYRPRTDRGHEVDPARVVTFSPGTALDDVIDRMVTILQADGS